MPVLEPHYLSQAISQASELRLFDHPRVRELRGRLPDWVRRFQRPDGFEAFDREHGVTIPAALKEFWSRPDLMCAWTVAQLDALGETPRVGEWTGGRFLTFDMHYHSGSAAAVRLTGSDDPPVVLDEVPDEIVAETVSGYLEQGFQAFEQYSRRA